MSRDPYRPSFPRGGERWDRARYGAERERFEDRDSRFLRSPGYKTREVSVDDIYERRGPRGFEEDRYESRRYYDDEPKPERAPPRGGRDRGFTIEKEREREYYSPEPRRPAFLRRQSSLDTFDRRPLTKFVEREEYGPPARYYGPPSVDDDRPGPPPLTPVRRALPPPRHYEREFDREIKFEDDDDDFRGYPERVREREVIRRRRRSNSKESRSTATRSSSSSASSQSGTVISVRSEFPKKGKTRMPARLVNKKAIIDLGYPFEVEGDTIIIQKALGRENIDKVIKLSEDYNKGDKAEMSGGRSDGGSVVSEQEERRTTFKGPGPPPMPPPGFNPPPGFVPPPPPGWMPHPQQPPPPPPGWMPQPGPPPPPKPQQQNFQSFQETKVSESDRSSSPASSHRSHKSHKNKGPVILETDRPRDESRMVERRNTFIEESEPMAVGPLAMALPEGRHRVASGEKDIRERIKQLEMEKEALKAERKANHEMRKADRIRSGGSSHSRAGGEMVLYEKDKVSEREFGEGREMTVVKRETKVVEPEGGVRIEKDRKGRMSISVPKYT